MLGKLKIQQIEINSICPNKFNSNVVTLENKKKIEDSLTRFGMFKPILCRQSGDTIEIIGGENRWEAAKKLGMKDVPIINLGELSDSRAKEISLSDNARYGADDSLKLSDLMNSLDDAFDLSSFLPISDIEIETLMSATKFDFDSLELMDDDDLEEMPIQNASVKTHTIMRFKVSLEDASEIQEQITAIMKANGFSESDALTNAGDALTHILLNSKD